MAHAVHSRDLGRNRSWRKATVQSLSQALLKYERINTTRAKAREAQRSVERLITLGKEGTLSARRHAAGLLNDPQLVRRLFLEIAPRFQNRAGGYTRVLHNGYRAGDSAEMAVIELVELAPEQKAEPKGKEKKEKKLKPAGKEKEEKPAEKPPKKEPAAETKPETEPATPPKAKTSEPQERPKGFVDGLRKFFKRRDNP